MKLTERIYLVGGGQLGISHDYDCHVYLVDGGGELALIDSGAGEETEQIISNIEGEGYDPGQVGKVFLTHAHADHIGGARSLKEELGSELCALEGAAALIEGGDEEELGLKMAKRSGVYAPDYRYPHVPVDRGLRDGETVKLGDISIEVIHVPGHSEFSTCYGFKRDGYSALFSGDVVLFQGEIGLLNCPGSSLKGYREHFHKLAERNFQGLFPGHKLFVLYGGQESIDLAEERLTKLAVPPTFFNE
ncbi:MAG: MBL fold metallo-hydrolase [Candidatus Bipolaricaulota bacterium]